MNPIDKPTYTFDVAKGILKNADEDKLFCLNELDPYTQQPLAMLLLARQHANLPLFVVEVEGRVFEAENFIHQYFIHKIYKNPVTNAHIKNFNIYKSRRKDWGEFKFVCNQQSFPGKDDHWCKYIMACSESLKEATKGYYQFYVGSFYEKLAKELNADSKVQVYLSKAKFWLKLARKNGNRDACLKLAIWYSEGNTLVKRKYEKVEKHLKMYITSSDSPEGAISICYKAALQEHQSQIASELKLFEDDSRANSSQEIKDR